MINTNIIREVKICVKCGCVLYVYVMYIAAICASAAWMSHCCCTQKTSLKSVCVLYVSVSVSCGKYMCLHCFDVAQLLHTDCVLVVDCCGIQLGVLYVCVVYFPRLTPCTTLVAHTRVMPTVWLTSALVLYV